MEGSPKGVLRRIESLMANFLWNDQGERRAHWINWNSICTPIDEGGLGFEKFDIIRRGLHAKLLWLVLEDKSLWASYARSKYFCGSSPNNTMSGVGLWRNFRF